MNVRNERLNCYENDTFINNQLMEERKMSNLLKEQYMSAGITEEVYDFCDRIADGLKERFEKIDEVAQINQIKVLSAWHKEPLSDLSVQDVLSHLQVMDMMILAGKLSKQYMPMYFMPNRHLSVRSLPAEHTHLLRLYQRY